MEGMVSRYVWECSYPVQNQTTPLTTRQNEELNLERSLTVYRIQLLSVRGVLENGRTNISATNEDYRTAEAIGVAGVQNNPSRCLAVRDGQKFVAGQSLHSIKGGNFVDGYISRTGFNTVLPPNSPSWCRKPRKLESRCFVCIFYHPVELCLQWLMRVPDL